MTTKPIAVIAAEREQAAADFDQAIEWLGAAFARFNALTAEISEASGVDQAHALTNAISMRMADAGLGSLLERKLVGRAAPLRDLVAGHHGKLLTRSRT